MPFVDSAQRELPYQSASPTSYDAAIAAASFAGQQGQSVLRWFAGRPQGGTQKECSAETGIGRASVAARVNALEQSGHLVKTTERREGCAVYRLGGHS